MRASIGGRTLLRSSSIPPIDSLSCDAIASPAIPLPLSGFVLEGQLPWELPEVLIGAARVSHLNVADAKPLDISREIPLLRPAAPRMANS